MGVNVIIKRSSAYEYTRVVVGERIARAFCRVLGIVNRGNWVIGYVVY